MGPLVGLTGHLGSGKDSVGAILCARHGYQRNSWANALKREVYGAFGQSLLHDLCDDGLLPQSDDPCGFVGWLAFLDAHKYDAPESEFGWIRPLLQFWGSEYRRLRCGEDYWVRKMRLYPGLVITDCRFPNEVQAIHDAGGVVWKVVRPDHGGDSHMSESGIDALPCDAIIDNSGTIEDLERAVDAAMKGALVAA